MKKITKSKEEIVKEIAIKVKEHGGKTYYVGGYVRDKLLGNISKDLDIEVHGIDPNTLEDIIDSVEERITIGESFGIYSLKHYDIDIALPRKENLIGKGHKDFDIIVDPFIGEEKAALRRDFTINALMEDVLTGEILDFYHGLDDLKNHLIRHVNDDSFSDDPLRVFRACQFSARFNFDIDETTVELCKHIDTTTLSKERVEAELKKALLKSDKPSIFFEALRKMNQLDYWFKELSDLINVKQNPIFHPEGDAYTHTLIVLDRGVKYLDSILDKYPFMLALICHDLGKKTTTEVKNGKITSYKHEEQIDLVKSFLSRFTSEKKVIQYVQNMTLLHMKTHCVYKDNSCEKTTNHLFDSSICPNDLIYLSLADTMNNNEQEEQDKLDFLRKRLEVFNELMSRPYVMGEDLIKAGIEPSTNFKEALIYAHKLRLAGIDKDSQLKQTLSYIKKIESE